MKRALAGLLAIALCSPAHAAWQGFDWGMTPEQAEATESPIDVYKLPSIKRRTKGPYWSELAGSWTKDGNKYRTSFFFDGRGELVFVELEPDRLPCTSYASTLPERFGESDVTIEENEVQGRKVTKHLQEWSLSEEAKMIAEFIEIEGRGLWSCHILIHRPGWSPGGR